MKISPLAGKPTEQNILVNIPSLVTAYYTGKPDIAIFICCSIVLIGIKNRLSERQLSPRNSLIA